MPNEREQREIERLEQQAAENPAGGASFQLAQLRARIARREQAEAQSSSTPKQEGGSVPITRDESVVIPPEPEPEIEIEAGGADDDPVGDVFGDEGTSRAGRRSSTPEQEGGTVPITQDDPAVIPPDPEPEIEPEPGPSEREGTTPGETTPTAPVTPVRSADTQPTVRVGGEGEGFRDASELESDAETVRNQTRGVQAQIQGASMRTEDVVQEFDQEVEETQAEQQARVDQFEADLADQQERLAVRRQGVENLGDRLDPADPEQVAQFNRLVEAYNDATDRFEAEFSARAEELNQFLQTSTERLQTRRAETIQAIEEIQDPVRQAQSELSTRSSDLTERIEAQEQSRVETQPTRDFARSELVQRQLRQVSEEEAEQLQRSAEIIADQRARERQRQVEVPSEIQRARVSDLEAEAERELEQLRNEAAREARQEPVRLDRIFEDDTLPPQGATLDRDEFLGQTYTRQELIDIVERTPTEGGGFARIGRERLRGDLPSEEEKRDLRIALELGRPLTPEQQATLRQKFLGEQIRQQIISTSPARTVIALSPRVIRQINSIGERTFTATQRSLRRTPVGRRPQRPTAGSTSRARLSAGRAARTRQSQARVVAQERATRARQAEALRLINNSQLRAVAAGAVAPTSATERQLANTILGTSTLPSDAQTRLQDTFRRGRAQVEPGTGQTAQLERGRAEPAVSPEDPDRLPLEERRRVQTQEGQRIQTIPTPAVSPARVRDVETLAEQPADIPSVRPIQSPRPVSGTVPDFRRLERIEPSQRPDTLPDVADIPETFPDTGPDPFPEPGPDPKPDPRPDPMPDPFPGPEPEPKPDPIPDPLPDPVPSPSPDPVPDPTPGPVPDPTPVQPEPGQGIAARQPRPEQMASGRSSGSDRQFVRELQWKQGPLYKQVDVVTGKVTTSKKPKAGGVNPGVSPRQTIKVTKRSPVAPRKRRVDIGKFIANVGDDSLTFSPDLNDKPGSADDEPVTGGFLGPKPPEPEKRPGPKGFEGPKRNHGSSKGFAR